MGAALALLVVTALNLTIRCQVSPIGRSALVQPLKHKQALAAELLLSLKDILGSSHTPARTILAYGVA